MKEILAAILGGIVVFVWNAVSWMVLDWHTPTIRQFSAPSQVAQVLVEQAPGSGIYVLNYPGAATAPDPAATSVPAEEAAAAVGQPFAFVAFAREGIGDEQMTRQLAYSLAADILAALLIVLLVRATGELSYLERAVFIGVIAFVIAIAGRLPNWIWWHYPRDYMVLDIADVLIGWGLAALVIAALTGPDNGRPGLSYRRVRM